MNKAIEALKNGGTILYPTDTIWGIGCDATDENACQKLLDIKQRPENKSFIILVDNFAMLERYIPEFQEVCYDLADFASKPLTIIYPKAKGLAPSILAKDGSIGIRITTDPICQKLIRSIRKPIVSTSANLSGESNPTCFDDINEGIKSGVDAIVEERTFEKMEKPSQIVKVGIDGKVQVIRK
ncbi:MAG TPA: threonylcarbamoyl-AMP synthase [Crocinitomicaceae bacterium]|nr:threonylcarbamoyl-AMP synthase [Crocinitomicaceae bacterium]